MQDRRHRATLRTPQQGQSSLLLRERRPSSTEPDDNPFAPPPENRPDQPWQPRRPANGDDDSSSSDPSSPPGRGSQWSPVQPGRQDGGFGSNPQRQGDGPNEPGGGKGGPGPGMRWDPKDPVQRRARYALLAGMWAFFFALFNLPQVALLLGALALYWGISSLRAKPQQRTGDHPAVNPPAAPAAGPPAPPSAPPAPGPHSGSARPRTTAAVSGLVAAGLALLIVALTFASQLVYRDYYSCVDDSLTKQGQLDCNKLLPDSLVPVLGTKK
ncbi:hypothetical protein [Streptomyces sp. NBC_00344]|uniref:hypothetical protein n=1 Tax=Streptomyces sp. NBC_00344 TaxID=2975720 RepID=UPI002E202C69